MSKNPEKKPNPPKDESPAEEEDNRVCSCGIRVARASMCTERDCPWR